MARYIELDALVAEIEGLKSAAETMLTGKTDLSYWEAQKIVSERLLSFINTLEVKEVDLIIHTVIAECCDWLAMNTNLSHDEIEGCRNLMLTVKEEQLKAQEGE